jgi:hypothetical protein
MTTKQKIYVAGHRGMVGSAIVRQLLQGGIRAEHLVLKTHAELDLTSQAAVQTFFTQDKPTQVYLAAAKVGGIHANNTYRNQFASKENLARQACEIEIDRCGEPIGKQDQYAAAYPRLKFPYQIFKAFESSSYLNMFRLNLIRFECASVAEKSPSDLLDEAIAKSGVFTIDV